MDMDKLYKLLMNDEELTDVPIMYIFKVALVVFKIINSGECMYDLKEVS